ncbi:TPA: His-Xaa-Ser system radical SAM maturase HxsC [Pseudomonas aeruginosa]|uniref:His-Xaa-Ser system radical SAM maturase HxsC n=1 Tax=Pseudomonas aeruginosa TaxID=287 RepID=UPI0024BF0534|nr:His-Xaa-Ser system radical SAM maturase HxsC [Pseudomonas aeruginosa]MDJ1369122.1 His-Xaa-Ser system radical SAM maturase HxsC [Pseudomonas aeruginosa]MDY1244314.1 His-Xaa-Ser system radical SAM maturase HxsC [Pseudomonas aeruginosa]HBO9415535.1 His-Xaa-Ser system radical SAM maturase HxsC [Pseudomonas aeruginosa]HBO9463372.1 His-Xaa-Ser system radical SAM maturase HxsC [Pseudomonas aeruginosa]HBO9475235.1 His-Xaa-Ser system radical SAM maturase HxsC [Pseudomonas aeruginosa]
MLRRETQFDIQNLSGPRLLKVITASELIEKGTAVCAGHATFNDLALWVEAHELREHPGLRALPVGAFLCPDQDAPDLPNAVLQLRAPKDPHVVRPGDVIALSPASNLVRALYRRGANSNLLFITDRCNSLCLMCSQPPKDIDDRWHIKENLRLIDLMDAGEEHLGISGGEPTLYREGLLEILARCRAVLPEKSIHLLSNGRLLKDSSWIPELKQLEHPSLSWGVPLYGDNADDHDHVVQAPGAFSETMQGLYNLTRADQVVEIRVVLSRLTTPRLPELAHFIFRNLPFVRHVALMGIESTGLAKKHYEELWIDPLDYQEQLSQSAFFLHNRGIPVSIYNLPLCVLPAQLSHFARQSISDWKNLFIDACQSCAAASHCAGFFKSHTDRWQSRGIRPFSTEEFATYARSAS